MENMFQTARMIEASSKLSLAAEWLRRTASNRNERPDKAGRDAMAWCEMFLSQVDWTSTPTRKRSVTGEMAVQATSLRPVFYSSLLGLRQRLGRAGFGTEAKMLTFLVSLYRALLSMSVQKIPDLSPELATIGAEFLSTISSSILVSLDNNGLPKTPTQLRRLGFLAPPHDRYQFSPAY
jgi:hypothetical protein